MTILIDKSTKQPISSIFPNGYLVDGIKPELPENIIEVDVIDNPLPVITQNQSATFEWKMTTKGWEKVWTITDVVVTDWLHDYPLRIVAPKMLVLVYPEIYIWFQVNDLPIEKVGDMVHLYCNEIMPEHQGLIDANSAIITVEPKPINQ